MNLIQRLLLNLVRVSLWPGYLAFMSLIAGIGPWPRSFGRPAAFVFTVMAMAIFTLSMLRWIFSYEGWIHQAFDMPANVLRQFRRVKVVLTTLSLAIILPEELISRGYIMAGGRAISAPTICHLMIIVFEISVVVLVARFLRKNGALGKWLATSPEQLGWLGRRRRGLRIFILACMICVIGLEVRGYGFTARRFALAGLETTVLLGAAWAAHQVCTSMITKHSWRWIRREAKNAAGTTSDPVGQAADLPNRLRHLADWGVPILACVLGFWIWDVDLALFNSVGDQKIWTITQEVRDATGDITTEGAAVKVSDIFMSLLFFVLTGVMWKYLSTIFVLLIYPKMPEDPGIRFAVLTLCRYLLLAIGVLAGLSCLQLGLDKIGVVLAALGVGLGFGLQEIVSNFVSGIILLLERPIRVGDVVTVAAMTGKIDRINIRATTLINSENQSLIIPNREFITGHLINWTHKDKIIRFSIHVNVALGSDPDAVTAMLLSIAKADTDVLGTPAPSSYLDSFGSSHLDFVLHVYVPDPSYPGRVRHRLCTQIQKRFAEAGIQIPLPSHELRVESTIVESVLKVTGLRLDEAAVMPSSPHIFGSSPVRLETK
jgi:potassium efflux system protein